MVAGRRRVAGALGVLVCVLVVVAAATTYQRDNRGAAKINLSVGASESAALVWIADALGYWSDVGLEVDLVRYEAGKLAADGLMEGRVDIATTAEFVVVKNSFEQSDVTIWAALSSLNSLRLIARRDRGVTTPGDLRGRTVGVTRGSTGEFFLGSFLLHHGMTFDDVDVVDLVPSQLVQASVAGEVDAILTWDPSAFQAEQQLGDNAISFPGQIHQDYYFVLVSKKDWLRANDEGAERVLKAMLRAEQFVAERPEEAQAILAERFGRSMEYMRAVWRTQRFALSLPQALLPTMEDEARWMIENGLVDTATIPNFLDHVSTIPIKRVSRATVTIIE